MKSFRSTLLVVASVLAFSTLNSPANAQAPTTCDNKVATIVSSDRIIYGTDGADVIVVEGAGRHKVLAGKGADIVCGSDSKDRIVGGSGPDKIFGNGERDYLIGGTGRDMIMAGPGNDTVFGGPSRDALNGEEGADNIDSGLGLNYCAADANDILVGDCVIDETAPTISDVTTPATVEAGTTAVFSWNSADSSGIYYTGGNLGGTYGWVTDWCGFTLEPQLISGTSLDGNYQVECTVPATAVNGIYSFHISSSDLVGQSNYVYYEFEVVGGIADNDVPNLVSIEYPETVVAGDTVTISLELTDESGVSGTYIYLSHDGFFMNITTNTLWAEYGEPSLVSGDAFSGVWQQQLTMSEFSPAGSYTIWYGVSDIYGNRNFITGPTFEYLG